MPFSVFPRCQCVCSHTRQVEHQRCSRTGRVKKNYNILRKNTIFGKHPVASKTEKYGRTRNGKGICRQRQRSPVHILNDFISVRMHSNIFASTVWFFFAREAHLHHIPYNHAHSLSAAYRLLSSCKHCQCWSCGCCCYYQLCIRYCSFF